eukprot:Hpha_TRINITY_DN14201_c0_g1::TRINITY_DN14201_c0_g1_i1::g.22677::m.22677
MPVLLFLAAFSACPPEGCGPYGSCDTVADACECLPGYGGDECDTCAPTLYNYPACDVACSPASCQGRGSCDSSGRCDCECTVDGSCWVGSSCEHCGAHHFGTACDVYCDPSVSCNGKGTCSDAGGCECQSGLCGATCSECCAANTFNWPECDKTCRRDTTCSGHGDCLTSGECECDTGFAGVSCDSCAAMNRYYGYPTCTRCPSVPGGAEEWNGTACVALPSPTPAPASPAPMTPSPPYTMGPRLFVPTASPTTTGGSGTDWIWWVIMIAALAGLIVCAVAAWWKLRKHKREAATLAQRSPQPPLTLAQVVPTADVVTVEATETGTAGIPIMVAPSQPVSGSVVRMSSETDV